ncbi:GvpL/GvpF family gas vesicle protein [Desulfoluna butyratoxydans]|uniref:Gas vesicle protein gvpl/gvpf n=1 Tax=Desulfoluna butyratoxydans TaxID=231438 RepID=A0A4U8YIC3_9BACT|nr:GvpL/GvpF family gas vesicle protein [Desulfoluna butyratoxydans]VFQ43067.1 gas vesicle protein gvpl/gvpf [Desulfoluna butyratoxydans]
MDGNALYLYGFMTADAPLRLGPFGLDNGEVVLKGGAGLAVAVSEVAPVDFPRLPRETLLKYVAEHQRVLEGMMVRGPVIPLKFGTVVGRGSEVEALLANGRSRILAAFEKARGKTELDVVARFSDFERELREIGATEAVAHFRREAVLASEADRQKARMTLGKMVKAELEQKRKGYAEAIVEGLKGVSAALAPLEVRDDAVIVSLAALVEEKETPRFEEALTDLDRRLEDRVDFRLIGPLPCNSFYTLSVQQVDFDEIDGARRCLSLPERVTPSDIREAYRLMVRECHPDSRSRGELQAGRFEDVSKSYRLLLALCGEGPVSFAKGGESRWLTVQRSDQTGRGGP